MLDAIVFDFDGVLVDSEGAHFAAFRDVAAGMGVSLDRAAYDAELIGFDDRDGFRAIEAKRRGGGFDPAGVELDPGELRALCERKQRAFDAIVAEGIDPLPGVRELLDEACGKVPVAIASGATRRDIDGVLDHLGWRDRFPIVVSADDVERSKPDPQTYAQAVRRLGATRPAPLAPAACLAIEDTAAGLASAKAAGLRTLGVATSGPASSLGEADRVAASLSGVTLAVLRGWFG